MKYWFVNLGRFYKTQRNGNYLWAPLYDNSGKIKLYWESMQDVNKGDLIFCNNGGKIMSIGVPKGVAFQEKEPEDFKNRWTRMGRKIELEYYDLKIPFDFHLYRDFILKNNSQRESPFDVSGNAKQGYLFPLDQKIALFFLKKIKDEKIEWIIAQEEVCTKELVEENLEEQEQLEKINNGVIKEYTKEEIDLLDAQPFEYTPKNLSKAQKREKTDPKLKATILKKAKYKCQIDPKHVTFTNVAGNQYMECHHIIPMNAQKDFKNLKLDSLFNLISICPICHRKIHYGNKKSKYEIFWKMYKLKEKEMKDRKSVV